MNRETIAVIDRASFAMNVASTVLLAGAAAYVLLVSTATWCVVQGRWETVFVTWAGIFSFLALVTCFAMRFHDTVPARVTIISVELALGAVVALYYLLQEKAWCDVTLPWNLITGMGAIAAGITAILLNVVVMATRRFQRGGASHRAWIAFIMPAVACGFVIAGASTNWFDPFYHARVPARGDAPPMAFTFWSQINTASNASYFTPSQWQQLDDHGSTIIVYGLNTSTNYTFSWARQVRDDYPRIKLMWPCFGGYYNGEQIEGDTSMYLHAIQAFGLSNTIGFVYDLERHNDTCWHDAALWADLQACMERCIGAIEAQNASYRIDNTAGLWMLFSHYPFGGGDQTEVLFQHALMSLAGTADWDGYQWQLYRGNAVSPASDPDSTNTYERMLTSVRGVGPGKTVPLLGMTGVGDYGPNNCTVDGVPCNFAGVIKDCRLARSLGIAEVGFYTLCDAGTWEGVYYPSMFEAYGTTFLDVLNASVNGLDEALIIDIPGNNAFRTTVGYYWEFVAYAVDGTALGIMACSSILASFLLDRWRRHPTRRAGGAG